MSGTTSPETTPTDVIDFETVDVPDDPDTLWISHDGNRMPMSDWADYCKENGL